MSMTNSQKHQDPNISSIDNSLSQSRHRVRSPTHRRANKSESKVANRDWIDHQACSLLQYDVTFTVSYFHGYLIIFIISHHVWE